MPVHKLVTRASYFRRRCARRRAIHKTDRYVLALTPRHRAVARHCTAISFEAGFPEECRGASPRRSRRPSLRATEAGGFRSRPVRNARSAEWELMSPFIWTPPVCQGILCAGRQEGCGFIHGLVPFAKWSDPLHAGAGLHIYIRPVCGTDVPGPNGFRPATPSYILGFVSPKTAQVLSPTVQPVCH